MTTWFTADNHFGHRNIILHCQRPFASVEEMDAAMIARWNERVAPRDLIYHLGDFAYRGLGAAHYLQQLNGRKILIKGNHDRGASCEQGWKQIYPILEAYHQRQLIVLCHYAMEVWNQSHRGSWHLFAHSHGRLRAGSSLRIDVGVDCHEFAPLSLDEVRNIMEQKCEDTR